MTAIKEDYVSFETAKLLKKKGFDEGCRAFYVIGEESLRFTFYPKNYNNNLYLYPHPIKVSAPTLQTAMKWLRNAHHIHIAVNPISEEGYNATIYDVADFDDCGIISDTEFFFHPEEAIEAAIKYCLENLI